MRTPIIHSHRFAMQIIDSTPELRSLFDEILSTITEISDDEIVKEFEKLKQGPPNKRTRSGIDELEEDDAVGSKMSISASINNLIDRKLVDRAWVKQAALFQGQEYSSGTRWRLDFSKTVKLEDSTQDELEGYKYSGMAIEVAFNHGEAIAWNLLKPVMAAELNHVDKQVDIGAGIGIVITATDAMRKAGGFDNSVGTYEKFLRYLKPMRNQLTVPMLILGLEPPETFLIKKKKNPVTGKNEGLVVAI